MSRRLDPIKVGATKKLVFAFTNARSEVIAMASGKITIWDPLSADPPIVANAAVVIEAGKLTYTWTGPSIGSATRRTCRVEFMGISVDGSLPYKSGADGRGDLEIDILASHTS